MKRHAGPGTTPSGVRARPRQGRRNLLLAALLLEALVVSFSASSSGISSANSSSKAITSSTVSRESAPKSPMNEASRVTCSVFRSSWSPMIVFTLTSRPGSHVVAAPCAGHSVNFSPALKAFNSASLHVPQ
jgi:hypothetical protein